MKKRLNTQHLNEFLKKKNKFYSQAPADSGKLKYDSKWLRNKENLQQPPRQPLTPAPPTDNNRFHLGGKKQPVRHQLDKFAF